MESDARRREFLIRLLALACSGLALAGCQRTGAGTGGQYQEPEEDEGEGGGEGGGY